MSTLAEIEEVIKQLPPEQLHELRQWIAERDWKQEGAQPETDVTTGKLDALREKLRARITPPGSCTED